ncbi:MAG: alpha-amylase family glycosyl hydrolase [Candidatus Woesearchaeota archaeon]
MEDYEWQNQHKKNILNLNFKPSFGPLVIKRNKENKAELIRFQVLSKNQEEIYLTGDFNNWEQNPNNLAQYKFKQENNTKILETKIKHKQKYKLLVITNNQKKLYQDPASTYFDDEGNSVFWDFEDPTTYKSKYSFANTKKSIRILQTDLPGLIVHYNDGQKLGQQIPKKNYFEFITKSGVIKKIKELGFNAIQFLPFAQSIDGDNWKFRYLVPFQHAIQKNWGDPDSFKQMIDEFHKHEIAVIGDFVLGHIPHKDYKIFGQDFENNGLHVWKKNHDYLYFKEETHWGTMRINYDDEEVRRFFVESCLHFQKNYLIDGFRIDNVDGIIRYGPNGDGAERENGRLFLKELNQAIYNQNSNSIINFEAHYFFEDNAKMLVAPIKSDRRALGATAYNSSRLTYYLHTEYMLKKGDVISAWKFKHINDEKEWGKSNSTIADFHNHDAAAGLMELRATGSFAYDAMTYHRPENHVHAIGKIKVMEAIISFGCEGRTLDLLQTFLLQPGTFEHDSSIRWELLQSPVSQSLVEYKKQINLLMEDEAFHPINTDKRKFLNVDDKNKILVITRESNKSKYVIIINLTSWKHHDYKVGLDSKKDFELILNSDEFKYSGLGMTSYPKIFENHKSSSFEVLDREIQLKTIAPYQVLILKSVD